MKEQGFSIGVLWQRLIRPHPSITEETDRRRAQTLAGLMLGLLIVGGIATLMGLVNERGQTRNLSTALFHLVLWGGIYALSRTRYPTIGAILLVVVETGVTFALFAVFRSPEVVVRYAVFLLLPILLSTLLLPARFTTGLAIACIVGLMIYPLLVSWLPFSQVVMPVVTVALVSVLAVAMAILRERDFGLLRRQTLDLQSRSQTLESQIGRHTHNLEAIAEVGRAITATRDFDQLLTQVVDLIIERFDFYHAQVFLIDDAGKNAVLKASTGAAGQELLARGHHLAVGSRSVIGQVTARGEATVVSDTDVDPIHRRNELLPQTRSEMALPLRVSGRVIGTLDIQSVKPNAFGEQDVSIFRAMADQLAIAIENARLFERAQHDLQDIETLNRQLTGEAWRTFLTGRSHQAPLGFESSPQGVRPILPDDQAAGDHPADGSLSLPLKVRGETIGQIDMTPRSGKEPDEDTRAMLAAVAERVAMALDSTRLGEQAQRQAEREQILSRLSAELQATTDLNTILRVVARETSHVLGAPTGFIHLTMEYGTERGSEKRDGADS